MINRRDIIREILDEDKKIYRQVLDRQKQQVSTMEESISPRKPADIGIEIKTENLVGQLRNLLENILTKLQLFIGRNWDGAASSTYPTLPTDYAKILNFWNEIIRRLVRPDIKTDFRTKQAIKSKIVELEPQINSLYYTIREYITALANKISNKVNDDIASIDVIRRQEEQPERPRERQREPPIISEEEPVFFPEGSGRRRRKNKIVGGQREGGLTNQEIFRRFFGPISRDPREKSYSEFPAMVVQISTIYAIISLIKKQIDSNNYRPITNTDIGIELRSFSQSLGPADESQFVDRDDDLFRFNVLLNHYINSNAGIKYGDQRLESRIAQAIKAFETENERRATEREIISIRQKYGQRGDAPLFYVPEIGGLSDDIYDENIDNRASAYPSTTSRDAIQPTERNQIDNSPGRVGEFPQIDLNPNFEGSRVEIEEQAESYRQAVLTRLDAFLNSPSRRQELDLDYVWQLTDEIDDALKEADVSTRQTDGDYSLIGRLIDNLRARPSTTEENIRANNVNINQLIGAFSRLFNKYVADVLIPLSMAETEERITEAAEMVRGREVPRMESGIGLPETERETEAEQPIISEEEPVFMPEGSGRQRRKPKKFSYKKGKLMEFDDSKNDMYN